ncbi:homocysteine S-methyltransferase family protein [Thalassotalea sp. PS06]|uniref:homocysteine S-methyltransferase family protein n=1 Tax=Thalassotalea sp. PS06 TaxID=2594005 RepID=UPI0011654670|nr:homocysteine S-methyltransferase family protein [Thalassotalea sp. PS06]QDP02299.1 homocysteine S-methyltransferase [Thalassotalea sp. PS06]
MRQNRKPLPQLSGELFLNDAVLETDIIFNKGVDIREFAAHTLLENNEGREVLSHYFKDMLSLAKKSKAGFILDCPTWKAHMHWAEDLVASENEIRKANTDSVLFAARLRNEFSENEQPIVLNALIGPKGDAYSPEEMISADDAEKYHAQQIGWLAETDVDMVTALTFTQAEEAIGAVRAAMSAGLPIVVSFTVETNGKLPTGQSLESAIRQVDTATDNGPAYFMINCAHPDHFSNVIDDAPWARRIRGLRCNASRLSHSELDECDVLDDGNPVELAAQYSVLKNRMPWLNVFGGCCGSDLRHITEIPKVMSVEQKF